MKENVTQRLNCYRFMLTTYWNIQGRGKKKLHGTELDLIWKRPKTKKKDEVITKRIGIAKGQNLYDDNYDFDEMNAKIAKMFEVME